MVDVSNRANRAAFEHILFRPRVAVWNPQRERARIPQGMGLDEQGRAMTRYDGGIKKMYAQTPRWEDLAWIRKQWDGPLVVKGILRVDDAIVVSNHGGNYMDGSMPSIRALPDIAEAVGQHTEVLFDSGVRSGMDVVRALALGAHAGAVSPADR